VIGCFGASLGHQEVTDKIILKQAETLTNSPVKEIVKSLAAYEFPVILNLFQDPSSLSADGRGPETSSG
jgi:hypothetical protein